MSLGRLDQALIEADPVAADHEQVAACQQLQAARPPVDGQLVEQVAVIATPAQRRARLV